MGRRKIEIQPLTDDRNRTVTFVKRKAGLFKKAHELAVLCQVDLAVIIVGNNNKLYEFSSVDTNQLIDVYQKTPKKQESKSPANYGSYQKKKHLTSKNLGVINDDEFNDSDENDPENDEDEEDDEDTQNPHESEYDSETPEPRPKRQKRALNKPVRTPRAKTGKNAKNGKGKEPPVALPNVPNLRSFRNSNSIIKEEEEHQEFPEGYYRDPQDTDPYRPSDSAYPYPNMSSRPVLRVQIPTDAKGSANDSARTLTALDTNPQPVSDHQATRRNPPRNPDPQDGSIPGSAKSSSPHSAGNDTTNSGQNGSSSTPAGGPNINTPKYSSFSTFRSPDTRKPITTLPIPIHSKSQTSSPSSATAPPLPVSGMTSFFNTLPQPSPSSQYPNSSVPTPILNQVFSDPKFRYQASQNQTGQNSQATATQSAQPPPPSAQGQAPPQANAPAPGGGNPDALMSGLPSKYVNDIFPSPSNFYVPQDWPNSGTGMTPVHSNVPQYFINMLPSANQGPSRSHSQSNKPGGPNPPQPHQAAPPGSEADGRPPSTSEGSASGQSHRPQAQSTRSSQGSNYQFPSPLQFMSPSFHEEKK